MIKQQHKGIFIVIDGTDGSGKGTQTVKLVERMQQEGKQVALADFPQYGKESAWFVEQYLNGNFGTLDEVGPYKSSVFYAVDRFAAAPDLRQKLESGMHVISNRYVTASMGHQGGKIDDKEVRHRYFQWLDHLEYNVMGIPKPDINIILHVPARVAQELVDKKPQRRYLAGVKRDIHEDDLEHLQKAERVYLEIAREFDNFELVSCYQDGKLLSIQEIHEMIWGVVHRYIN